HQFLKSVEPLRKPGMGTELMGPVLYDLVRTCRPRRVLEIGMGYTSAFLARALAENRDDFVRERAALVRKTRSYLDRVRRAERDRGESSRVATLTEMNSALAEWLFEPPALLNPSHYMSDYRPKLVAVDDFSIAGTSAPQVLRLLDDVGLSSFVV